MKSKRPSVSPEMRKVKTTGLILISMIRTANVIDRAIEKRSSTDRKLSLMNVLSRQLNVLTEASNMHEFEFGTWQD